MADFCTVCANEMGFPKDIDIDEIFDNLKPDYQQSTLCEGCGMIAIAKTSEKKLLIANFKFDKWLTKEEHFGKENADMIKAMS